jgi:hypothetical protein
MFRRQFGSSEVKRTYPDYLKSFTNTAFDFRQSPPGENVERWDARKVVFSKRKIRAIHAASKSLGMTGFHRPNHKSYDLGLVLGGRGAPVLVRMVHLKALMDGRYGRKVDFGKIGLLGCQRGSSEKERKGMEEERQDMLDVVERLPQMGIKVDMDYARQRIAQMQTEFDVMSVAAELVFGFRPDQSRDRVEQHGNTEHTNSIVRNLGKADGYSASFVVVSAPSSESSRRANTADTYKFVAEVPELAIEGRGRVGIVNTQLFRFQEPDAYRMFAIPSGHDVEMMGYPYRPPYLRDDDPRVYWEKGVNVFLKELRMTEKRQNRVLRRLGFSKHEAKALHEHTPDDRKAILQSRGLGGRELEIVMKGESRLMAFHGAARSMLQEINSAVNQSVLLTETLARTQDQSLHQRPAVDLSA